MIKRTGLLLLISSLGGGCQSTMTENAPKEVVQDQSQDKDDWLWMESDQARLKTQLEEQQSITKKYFASPDRAERASKVKFEAAEFRRYVHLGIKRHG